MYKVTLLAPWAAKTHYYLLMAARVLQGLAIGGLHPANVRLCLEWLPVQERARGMAVIMAGCYTFIIISRGVPIFSTFLLQVSLPVWFWHFP